ncbi:MAG: TRAP transporter small permease [Oscillibacter sp.]|nr:TRAP transporter small permease [Oscillibacter sp.]
MKNTLKGLQRLEDLVLVVAFVVMIAAIFIQVVNRNIFKIPVSGFEEAAKYCMVYMVMLGTELGLRDGSQIAVTGVVDKFRGKSRKVLQIVSKLIVIAFSVVMLSSGIGMVQKQLQTGQTSPGLGVPMAVPYAALPIAFGLIVVIQIGILVQMILNFNKPDEPEEKQEEVTE